MTAFHLEWPLPDVGRWFTYSPKHRVELTSHVVAINGGWWIFDPIPLTPPRIDNWLSRHPVRGIILTNTNHLRATGAWQRRCQCPVFVSPGFPGKIAGESAIHSREFARTGLEILPLDGGAPGERAFRIPALSLVVFGDAVVNLPDRTLEILPDRYATNPGQLRGRLASMVARPFERALFAHGRPLLHSAHQHINALL